MPGTQLLGYVKLDIEYRSQCWYLIHSQYALLFRSSKVKWTFDWIRIRKQFLFYPCLFLHHSLKQFLKLELAFLIVDNSFLPKIYSMPKGVSEIKNKQTNNKILCNLMPYSIDEKYIFLYREYKYQTRN